MSRQTNKRLDPWDEEYVKPEFAWMVTNSPNGSRAYFEDELEAMKYATATGYDLIKIPARLVEI